MAPLLVHHYKRNYLPPAREETFQKRRKVILTDNRRGPAIITK